MDMLLGDLDDWLISGVEKPPKKVTTTKKAHQQYQGKQVVFIYKGFITNKGKVLKIFFYIDIPYVVVGCI